MSYPDLPNNRLVVNGVDLSVRFQMVLLDGYTLNPPEPKTYTVDIPGGNGVIDLTESLTGDVVYNQREQEFTFAVIDVKNFENVKTEVSNFLHGRAFDYTMTMDPGYTYHGRFSIESYSHAAYANGILGTFKIKVTANPYKFKENKKELIDCTGGKWIKLQAGRKPEYATFSFNNYTLVSYYDKNKNLQTLSMNPGVYVIRTFKLGNSITEIYVNSKRFFTILWNEILLRPDVKSTRWEDVAEETWETVKEKPWTYGIQPSYISKTWNEAISYTWDNIHNIKLSDTEFKRNTSWNENRENRWKDMDDKTWSSFVRNVDSYNGDVLIEYNVEDL